MMDDIDDARAVVDVAISVAAVTLAEGVKALEPFDERRLLDAVTQLGTTEAAAGTERQVRTIALSLLLAVMNERDLPTP